jgi:predicted ATP-grasp superfamily ATP-dependent carboligase
MRVLLGDISSYKAIVVAKFLKKSYSDIEIYTFDSRKFTKIIRTKYSDRHFTVSSRDINRYIELIEEYKIDYFIPVINEGIKKILKIKDKFGKSLEYLGDYETFEKLNNKKLLMSLAKELNIKIPETYENINSAKYPCVIKPTNLSSAKGVVYIYNQDDLEKAKKIYRDKENLVVQEYVEGVGVGYSMYVKDGEIEVAYGHKRLAENPISGGSSVYRESFEDSRMETIAKKILKKWNWRGFAMFEFKLTKENKLYLIEVNPRIWGSINQGLENNINYFETMLGKTTKQKRVEQKTYLSPLIYFTLLKYLLIFDFKHLFEFIKNIKSNRADVSICRDPKGFLSLILRKLL